MRDDAGVHLASVEEKKRLWWRNALTTSFFIFCWFLFATLLSVYNKWMFSPDQFGFPFPLFVTTLHMVVQFCMAALVRYIWPQHFKPDSRPSKRDYVRRAVPTGVTTSLDIGLSNFSLKFITLSFYTMCKSSTLIFVLLCAFAFRLETFSLRLIFVIALVFSGEFLMVATETQFVLSGFLLVISASALSGFRWSLTQLLLKDPRLGMNNPAATLFWLTPTMAATLAIVSLFIDGWGRVFSSHFFYPSELPTTLLFLSAPGVVAFCMVLSEFYILQRAGVLPMSLAGIVKEVTTLLISAGVFGDRLTPLNITGLLIAMLGIVLYTYHKYQKSIESNVPVDAHGLPVDVDVLGTSDERTALRRDDDLEQGADVESSSLQRESIDVQRTWAEQAPATSGFK